jgi:Ca2+-binding RTX toxin-like protein
MTTSYDNLDAIEVADAQTRAPASVAALAKADSSEISPLRVIYGTDEINHITGDHTPDEIYALGGNDTVWAGLGNDKVYGGMGSDTLNGGGGGDLLYGGTHEGAAVTTRSMVAMTMTTCSARRATTPSMAAITTTASMATKATMC